MFNEASVKAAWEQEAKRAVQQGLALPPQQGEHAGALGRSRSEQASDPSTSRPACCLPISGRQRAAAVVPATDAGSAHTPPAQPHASSQPLAGPGGFDQRGGAAVVRPQQGPQRTGRRSLAFAKRAVAPHARNSICGVAFSPVLPCSGPHRRLRLGRIRWRVRASRRAVPGQSGGCRQRRGGGRGPQPAGDGRAAVPAAARGHEPGAAPQREDVCELRHRGRSQAGGGGARDAAALDPCRREERGSRQAEERRSGSWRVRRRCRGRVRRRRRRRRRRRQGRRRWQWQREDEPGHLHRPAAAAGGRVSVQERRRAAVPDRPAERQAGVSHGGAQERLLLRLAHQVRLSRCGGRNDARAAPSR